MLDNHPHVRARLFDVFLPASIVLALAVFAGFSAALGKVTYIVPVFIVLSIPLLLHLGQQLRFLAFLSLPILALFQMPGLHLPLGIPPVMAVMGMLAVIEAYFWWNRGITAAAAAQPLDYLPLLLLTLGGLISGLRNGELIRWFIFPFMFLLWFFLAKNFLRSKRDALRVFQSIFISILGYFLIVTLMRFIGHSETLNLYGADWRLFGRGEQLSLGPISYTIWSIEFGTIAGIGSLIAVFFMLQKGLSFFWRGVLLACLGIFIYILAMVAARGATIATAIGAIGLVTVTRRDNFRVGILLALVGVFLIIFQDTLLALIPSQTIQRFLELQGDPSQVSTFQYRINLMKVTLQGFSGHPFGAGYNYLWSVYGLDESIMYSSILNGTGLIGAIGFVLWMTQLAVRFIINLPSQLSKRGWNYAALGLAVWLFGCLNGLVSSSILLEPVISFMFWTTLITAYQAAHLPNVENTRASNQG